MRKWFTRLIGNRGERAAARYLRQQGMRILARQYTTRYGEIDLIARDSDTVVFVEVKTRSSMRGGHPAEAVTTAKQLKLTRTAIFWLRKNRLERLSSRFDVVALLWTPEESQPRISHYRNAFEPAGGYDC